MLESDSLSARLSSIAASDLEHYALSLDIEELLKFCIEKANEAKVRHLRAANLETQVLEIIEENYPFFLAYRRNLRHPGRRKKRPGIPTWGEFLRDYFGWCSRRTVYRAFIRLEQRVNILRGRANPLAERSATRYFPTQREMKALVEAAPIGTALAQVHQGANPDYEEAKRLADEYLRLGPSITLKQEFFPESPRSSDGFCPENYNQTFPFYPPLSIHPKMGSFGCFFCRPDNNFTGLFWGVNPALSCGV